jgi:hypothetical protein
MDPVAELLGSGRTVAYHVSLAHATGSVNAGLLLSQFWYFSGLPTAKERDGWFYITQDEIALQTGLIREEQDGARRRLKALGILQEERKGNPARLWYHIDKGRLYQLLKAFAEQIVENPQSGNATNQIVENPQTRLREIRKLVRGKATNKLAGFPQSIPTGDFSEISLDVSETRTPSHSDPPGGDADPLAEAWRDALAILSGQVLKPTFETHLRPLRLLSLDEGGKAQLLVPSPFTYEWLFKRELPAKIEAALAEVTGLAVRVELTLATKEGAHAK